MTRKFLCQISKDEATKVFEDVVREPTATAWNYHNAAIAYVDARKFDRAIELERKALTLMDFGAAREELALAFQNKSFEDRSAGRYDQAKSDILEGQKYDPKSKGLAYEFTELDILAYLRTQDRHWLEDLKGHISEFAVLDPKNPQVTKLLGMYDNFSQIKFARQPASATKAPAPGKTQ